jgi:hypothetical protein
MATQFERAGPYRQALKQQSHEGREDVTKWNFNGASMLYV